jgi:sirohydrochlorin ferrochelatase
VSASNTALVVFAHGSSIEPANEAVREVCRTMAGRAGYMVEAAFLDGGQPSLAGAVASLAGRGADRVIVIPYFLTPGLHLQRDLPQLIERAQAEHPGIRVEVTLPLDGHPALAGILIERAEAAMKGKAE